MLTFYSVPYPNPLRFYNGNNDCLAPTFYTECRRPFTLWLEILDLEVYPPFSATNLLVDSSVRKTHVKWVLLLLPPLFVRVKKEVYIVHLIRWTGPRLLNQQFELTSCFSGPPGTIWCPNVKTVHGSTRTTMTRPTTPLPFSCLTLGSVSFTSSRSVKDSHSSLIGGVVEGVTADE